VSAPVPAPEDAAAAVELETRHYIGVTPLGRLHLTLGPDHPDKFVDPQGRRVPPTEPLPTKNGACLLYPVSAEIAAEWDLDDEEEGNV